MHRVLTAILLATILSASGALAQQPERPQKKQAKTEAPQSKKTKAEKAAALLKEKTSRTQHTVRIGKREVKYTATAGTMVMKTEEGKPKAAIFYVAYTRNGVQDLSKRPITFAYNGGPGSSSIWLHMGAFGPMRVLLKDDGHAFPPPYKRVDNEDSILDVTDLVFIDPVSTGYSRTAPGESPKQFHGIQEDVKSVGDFIRLYTTRNNRWGSPKFLAGESYGTTRSAALSGYLQKTYGMYLNGIVLISSVLNFETLLFGRGNDMPAILYIPSYTATAWYHKKLPADLQAEDLATVVQQAREFALGEYNDALMKGDALTAAERQEIVDKLARFTGLSPEYIDRSNLRIHIMRYVKELLRSERRTVGRLDSRFKGIDYDAAGERFEYDPSMAAISGAFTAVFNAYVRENLKFATDLPYNVFGPVRPWNFKPYENRYVYVGDDLRQAMTQNPDLRVLVANGYYDLATPFFATEYTVDHLGLDPTLRSHITLKYYEAGHMMYIDKASHAKLKADVAQFILDSIQQQ